VTPPGPVPREHFIAYAKSRGWFMAGHARHGEKWKKEGASRPIIIPKKTEIYPSVLRDCLDTMMEKEDDFWKYLGRK